MSAAGALPAPAGGPLARADVRAKLALLGLASTLVFVWNSLALQAAFVALVALVALMGGVPPARIGRMLAILLPAFALVLVVQGLWSPFGRTPVWVLPPGLPLLGGRTLFTVEGLLFGLVVCARITAPMLAFLYVFETTTPAGLVVGLVRMGVPYRVAFLVSTTFRFVPLLLEEFHALRDAQRLRGVDVGALGPARRLMAMGRMIVPLILAGLARAQRLEIALQARGFSADAPRSFLDPGRERLSALEWAAILGAGLLLVGAIAARLVAGVGGAVA